ncbi:MAG TPA: 30S ribosomal protein S4 [Bacteroidetes bacterium]|jgi:small subunit ribosomal protein S4|nr:30S ribosomal protein S4 [Bacteroidota bacterium]
MKYNGPKVKISRKLGFSVTPKSRKYLDRNPAPPGQHGAAKKRAKLSDYAKQLLEKQRLRLQYNLHERQMTNYIAKAARIQGNKVDILVQLLEQRLDSLVFRSGLARSMYAARQYVRHGHISVNGKKVDMPAYAVQPNDVIAIREKSRKVEAIQEAIRSASPPPYLDLSKADYSVKFLYLPPREEVPAICEVPLVIEYYSR